MSWTISKQTGLIKNSNTQCLIGKSLKIDLENKLKKTISIENDANCFTMAESKMGAGVGFDLVFGVIMGTGVGGGIVINNSLHSGKNNIAGEWGHHTLHRNGNPCYCGKSGCVETYISGPSLEKRWNQLTGLTQSMPEIINNFDIHVGKKWKDEFLENLGYGLANVIDHFKNEIKKLWNLSNIDFLYIVKSWSFISIVILALLFNLIGLSELGNVFGTPTYPRTWKMLQVLHLQYH